jgi:hypothetical protein
MKDENYRELNYVECRTFRGSQCVKMVINHYPPKEAREMYQKVIAKYTGTAVKMLICHRKENHELINSHLI